MSGKPKGQPVHFGHGELSTPEVRENRIRREFILALRRKVPEALEALRDDVYPVFLELLSNNFPSDVPPTYQAPDIQLGLYELRCNPAPFPERLTIYLPLHSALLSWGKHWHLDIPWLLDEIPIELARRAPDDSPVSRSERRQFLKDLRQEGFQFKNRKKNQSGDDQDDGLFFGFFLFHPVAFGVPNPQPLRFESSRPYDPSVEQWTRFQDDALAEFKSLLREYRDSVESTFQAQGFNPTNFKRDRFHFDMAVEYVVRAAKVSELAHRYNVVLTSATDAIHEVLETLGIPVRDVGRPKKTTD